MKQIKIENNNGSIRLKFQVENRRFSLSPIRGGKYGDEWDMRRATAIAEIIRSDIESGKFDPTLVAYKPKSSEAIKQSLTRAKRELVEMEQVRKRLDLAELWQKYSDFKRPSVKPSTFKKDYQERIGKLLGILPTTDLGQAMTIRDWITANKPAITAKKVLTQLSACCNWAIEAGFLEFNPFALQARKIKVPKKAEDDDINPFTAWERDAIIAAFEGDRYYRHYANLVKFLFFTGCRPNEAIALEWKDIKGNKLTFSRGFVYGESQKGLKTQGRRTIILNNQVLEILNLQRKFVENYQDKILVFPSPNNLHIDWHNFTRKAWLKILSQLPDIEYRNPYQTRHTFITLAIQAGVSYPDLAKHCGNSPEIILKKYQGVSRGFVMPEI